MSQDINVKETAGRRLFHNAAPRDLPSGAPMDAVKAEFGRRIQARLVEKGWNQSELARAASKFMPGKTKLTRDNVSNYVRGQQIPGPTRMKAICDALGVKPVDLVPAHAVQSTDDAAPPLAVKTLGDGRVFLQINQVTSMDVAMKIMAMLNAERS